LALVAIVIASATACSMTLLIVGKPLPNWLPGGGAALQVASYANLPDLLVIWTISGAGGAGGDVLGALVPLIRPEPRALKSFEFPEMSGSLLQVASGVLLGGLLPLPESAAKTEEPSSPRATIGNEVNIMFAFCLIGSLRGDDASGDTEVEWRGLIYSMEELQCPATWQDLLSVAILGVKNQPHFDLLGIIENFTNALHKVGNTWLKEGARGRKLT
jgi:hypothetical protein